MRRGMRKFVVIAAHRVTRKNPSLRTTNLMSRASCAGKSRSDAYAFGVRWRATTPQSGTAKAAGCAYWFFDVTQPPRVEVLYSYQSTPSVIGMIGTSRTIACSSCHTTFFCVARLVVVAYFLMALSTAGFEYRSQFDTAILPIGAEADEYSSFRSS